MATRSRVQGRCLRRAPRSSSRSDRRGALRQTVRTPRAGSGDDCRAFSKRYPVPPAKPLGVGEQQHGFTIDVCGTVGGLRRCSRTAPRAATVLTCWPRIARTQDSNAEANTGERTPDCCAISGASKGSADRHSSISIGLCIQVEHASQPGNHRHEVAVVSHSLRPVRCPHRPRVALSPRCAALGAQGAMPAAVLDRLQSCHGVSREQRQHGSRGIGQVAPTASR